MKRHILLLTISILMGVFSPMLYSQEKTQSYYNRHETEILPDARVAFRNCDYERTVELCKWHYIIVGDHSADSLREKAQRCSQLSNEMNSKLAKGEVANAKKTAEALLQLNQNDTRAKEILAIVEMPPVDSLEQKKNEQKELEEKVEEIVKPEETVTPEAVVVQEEKEGLESVDVLIPTKTKSISSSKSMQFAVKARASVLDLSNFAKTIAPGVGLGVYDIAGSRFGAELGLLFCPLSGNPESVFGIDASLLFRATEGIFPKAFLGAFNCSSTQDNVLSTKGMFVGAGVSFILAKHVCIDLGLSYIPEVKLNGIEIVSTSGITYNFPVVSSILSGGISPTISLGWAF